MQLIMLKGVPASGKTTWALEQEALLDADGFPPTVRVNKDDIRRRLLNVVKHDERHVRDIRRSEHEIVIPERDRLIRINLAKGLSVIVDDTNLAPKHEMRLRELAAEFKADFSVRLFDPPLAECVARNAGRPPENQVPEHVIYRMYNELHPPPEAEPTAPYVNNPDLPTAILCDLDGTLALIGKRSPYDASHCDELDTLNEAVAVSLRQAIAVNQRASQDALAYGYAIPYKQLFTLIFMSGREEKDRIPTVRFLSRHDFPSDYLYMRPTGDRRKDSIVKGELFDQHVRNKFRVAYVLDDRDQVVKMWRQIGLPCFQVAEGAF